MNTRQLLVASLVTLSSGAALADDPTIDTTPFHSTRSRAEVKADVQIARVTNQLLPAGEREAATPFLPSYGLARATVKAEVLTARAEGRLMPAGELIDGAPRYQPMRSLEAPTLARR